MSGFLGDLRYAIRSLGKSRGLTAVAVLVLALGVGANTALFSAVDAALLKALPYPGGDRLVSVFTTARSDPSETLGISPARLRRSAHRAEGRMSLQGPRASAGDHGSQTALGSE